MSDAAKPRPFLKLRGRSFIAAVLAPESPVEPWLAVLDAEMARAPEFFAGRPVVLDLSLVLPGDAQGLVESLRDRSIRVIGVEGLDAEAVAAGSWGLPPMLSGGREHRMAQSTGAGESQPEAAVVALPPPSLVIDRPVRSGQTIMFESGDVTVIGSVSSGAEIVAGGSIHIYGALRGRAVAGLLEHGGARIFCGKFDAELLAIEGVYRTADEIGAALQGRPAQAWLANGELQLTALG